MNNHYRIQPPIIPFALWDKIDESWVQSNGGEFDPTLGSIDPRDNNGLAARVIWNSDKRLHLLVEKIARYFRREFNYDFVQYSAAGAMRNHAREAFLWSSGQGGYKEVVIGACCFGWTVWRDHAPAWALQWIWLHPYERNRGHLKRAWPYFLARFGAFYVEPPLSPAMRAFVAKHDTGFILPANLGAPEINSTANHIAHSTARRRHREGTNLR